MDESEEIATLVAFLSSEAKHIVNLSIYLFRIKKAETQVSAFFMGDESR